HRQCDCFANTRITTGNEGFLTGKRCANEAARTNNLGFPDVHLPLRCVAAGEVAIWNGAWKCRWAIVSMRLGYCRMPSLGTAQFIVQCHHSTASAKQSPVFGLPSA